MAAQLQLTLPERPTWGGRRAGAGRKAKGPRRSLPHVVRDEHDPRNPVQVTTRVCRGIPSLRALDHARTVGECIRESHRADFRVIQFSILGDHLHFIVEASSSRALSGGLQALFSRIARRLNRVLGRTGRLFVDRPHLRELMTPREVHHSLQYVLCNWLKHGEGASGVDPCSSARWFTGWSAPQPAPSTSSPVAEAQTWLAAKGWLRGGGPISPDRCPGHPR